MSMHMILEYRAYPIQWANRMILISQRIRYFSCPPFSDIIWDTPPFFIPMEFASSTLLGHYPRHIALFSPRPFLPTGLVTNRVGKRFGFSISILPTNNLAECNKIGWLFNKCSSSSMFDWKRGGSCMEQAQ